MVRVLQKYPSLLQIPYIYRERSSLSILRKISARPGFEPGSRAPHRAASSVSLLLTVVLIGLVLVTLIWSMSELDAEV